LALTVLRFVEPHIVKKARACLKWTWRQISNEKQQKNAFWNFAYSQQEYNILLYFACSVNASWSTLSTHSDWQFLTCVARILGTWRIISTTE